jgi:hypothetical protein
MAGMALAAPPAACGSAVTSLFAQGGGKIGENREEKAQRWPMGFAFARLGADVQKGIVSVADYSPMSLADRR